jgi:heterodisulfide reductase subunit A
VQKVNGFTTHLERADLKTFRNAVASVGINPFLCEVANVREHCSWVHPDKAGYYTVATHMV